MKSDTPLAPYTKINSIRIKDLNVRLGNEEILHQSPGRALGH